MTLFLAILGGLAFGFGVAAVMHLLMRNATNKIKISGAGSIAAPLQILGWFVGNGAVFTATFMGIDLEHLLNLPGANGITLLCYMIGFGATAGVCILRAEPPPIHLLNQILGNRQMEVLLLVLRYDCTVEQAAQKLHVKPSEARELFLEAHRIIGRHGKRFFGLITARRHKDRAAQQPVEPETPDDVQLIPDSEQSGS